MSDLIYRLRNDFDDPEIQLEAADEIESLQSQLDKIRSDIYQLCSQEGNDGYTFDDFQQIADGINPLSVDEAEQETNNETEL